MGSHGTFLDELPPPLGPVGELLGVGLLDLGPLMHTVHEVIAEPVPVVNSLHRALVVPHLGRGQGQAGMGAVAGLPGSAPVGPGWGQGEHWALWECRDGAFALGLLKPSSFWSPPSLGTPRGQPRLRPPAGTPELPRQGCLRAGLAVGGDGSLGATLGCSESCRAPPGGEGGQDSPPRSCRLFPLQPLPTRRRTPTWLPALPRASVRALGGSRASTSLMH